MLIHVTGSKGFVGQYLVRELRQRGHDVTESGSMVALAPDPIFKAKPDIVIHAGAWVGRERCEREKERAVTLNVASTVLLAEKCAQTHTRLLYVSSAEVYGRTLQRRVHENEPLGEPWNLYALSKRWAEDACRLILPTELLTIARLGMQYGPREPGIDTLSNFIWAAMHGEDLHFFRDARRTWTWVEDTARALALLAEISERWLESWRHSPQPGIFNVESEEEWEMGQVAAMVKQLVGGQSSLIEMAKPTRYSDIPSMSTQRIRNFGWDSEVSLSDGIRIVYNRLLDFEGSEVSA